MKLIYMGTPDFAVAALKALKAAGHEIAYVVTQPDAVRDRGKKVRFSPVKEEALQLGIPVLQPHKIKKNEEFIDTIKTVKPDAIVVAAYGKLLPERLLEIPKYGCLNIHGSLLPRFRGAAPIQAAIIAGDEETGVTIMMMEKGLDTGDMLAKASTPIEKKTGEQIHDELAKMGAELIVKTLNDLQSGGLESGKIIAQKQDDNLSTYAPMISKEDGHIDFNMEPEEIERRIRAFDPWPGTFARIGDKTFKIWKAEVVKAATGVEATKTKNDTMDNSKNREAEPGTILAACDDGLDIAAGNGVLRVTEIQAPGKKRIPVKDFLRGNTIVIGAILR